MSRIFISYRRGDAAGHAGRLFDRLAHHVGADNIFMDIDDLEPGVDAMQIINDTIARCDLLLVVIGDRWLNGYAEQSVLDTPSDPVRHQLEVALARPDLRVIPVLVGDATLPTADQLPPSLQRLTRLQAIHLTDKDFHHQVDALAAASGPSSAPAAASMGKIFISYRRQDAAGYAGRLIDRLAEHFGPDMLATDSMDNCAALLVVIGDRWLEGNQLDDPADPVRRHLEVALARPEVRVIPVTVGDAWLPSDLPPSLMALTRRNAMQLADHSFHHDVDELIAVLERTLKLPGSLPPPPPYSLSERLHHHRAWWIKAGTLAGGWAIVAPLIARVAEIDGREMFYATYFGLVLGSMIAAWWRPTRLEVLLAVGVVVNTVLEISTNIVWKPPMDEPLPGADDAVLVLVDGVVLGMLAAVPALGVNLLRALLMQLTTEHSR